VDGKRGDLRGRGEYMWVIQGAIQVQASVIDIIARLTGRGLMEGSSPIKSYKKCGYK